jgi:hypothetical protein
VTVNAGFTMKNNLQIIITVLAIGVFSIFAGCSPSKQSSVKEGGLYAAKNDNGSFSILKVLKTDDLGVHVKIYSNQFPTPPAKVDESTLYLAGTDHKTNETFGVEHAPLSQKTFDNWKVTFVQQSTVKEDELSGYKTWLAAKGGYF